MRLRTVALAFFALSLAAIGAAQTVNLVGTSIADAGGHTFTGKLCQQAANNTGTVLSTWSYGLGGGQGVTTQVCYQVTTGVLQSGVTNPDTSVSNPQNLCMYTQLIDPKQPPAKQVVNTLPCLQPASSGQTSWCTTTAGVTTCNLNLYNVALSAVAIVQTGPPGPVGPAGPAGSSGSGSSTGYGNCSTLSVGMSPLGNALTPGFVSFGSSNYWHQNISTAAVDPNSASIIAFINSTSTNSQVSTMTISATDQISGVLRVGGYTGSEPMTVGRTVTFSNMSTSTFLNGMSVQITGIIGGIYNPTGFTAAYLNGYTHADYALTYETGTAVTTDTVSFVHPDFAAEYGIPFSIFDSSLTSLTNVAVTAYPTESDDPAMPIESYTPIESLLGNCQASTNDNHVVAIDRNSCWLYEMDGGSQCNGVWTSRNTAIWDLDNPTPQRPLTWTSVDAAGLPVLPGLVRYDEVVLGTINHAIRVTMKYTHHGYVSPASHWAGTDVSLSSPSPIPMGMRLRLKATFDISSYSLQNQVILTAMQQYGLIVADNGSNMYLTGSIDGRWNDSDLALLQNLNADDFDVIQMSPWYVVNAPNDKVTFSGLTNANFLNNQTVAVLYDGTTAGNYWSGFTANFTHANYAQASDTGYATVTLPAGMGTLASSITMPIQNIAITGNVMTVNVTANSGSDVPTGAVPVISSFTASPTSITAGQSATLTWSVTGSLYNFLTQSPTANPQVGVTRTTTQVVSPTATTTYTLNSQNLYGQSTQSATVTVH